MAVADSRAAQWARYEVSTVFGKELRAYRRMLKRMIPLLSRQKHGSVGLAVHIV